MATKETKTILQKSQSRIGRAKKAQESPMLSRPWAESSGNPPRWTVRVQEIWDQFYEERERRREKGRRRAQSV
jgi:hypothetical protein